MKTFNIQIFKLNFITKKKPCRKFQLINKHYKYVEKQFLFKKFVKKKKITGFYHMLILKRMFAEFFRSFMIVLNRFKGFNLLRRTKLRGDFLSFLNKLLFSE